MTTPYEQARTITHALLKGDTPPFTADLIRQRVLTANTIIKLDPEQIDRLVQELEASFNVWIGVQNVLDGDDDNHKGWLGGRRAEIKWRYWDRFQRLLEEEQGWPRETVERLGEMTDAVLERLEDPRREGPWDRRGPGGPGGTEALRPRSHSLSARAATGSAWRAPRCSSRSARSRGRRRR